MANWTQALNVRALAHVPPGILHQSYNAVLQEEFAALNDCVDAVAATFVKLQEVRDAVAKLEHSHGASGGRSDSLWAMMDATMGMNRELEKKVVEIGTGMKVWRLEKKRAREEDVEPKSPKVQRTAKQNGEQDRDVAVKANRGVVAEVKSFNDDQMDKSKDFDKLMNRGAVSEAVAASDSESSSSSASDNDEDAVEGSEAAWEALMTKSAGEKTSPFEKSRNEGSIKHVTSGADKSKKTETQPTGQSATYLKFIVEDVDNLSRPDRALVIAEVLVALKEAVEEDTDGTQQSDVANSLNILISWWAEESGDQIRHLESYREYATAIELYVDRLPRSAQKSELRRLGGTLSSVITSLGRHSKPAIKASKVAKATQGTTNSFYFATIIRTLSNLPCTERKHWLLRVLVAFKKETALVVDTSHRRSISKAIHKLCRILCDGPREPHRLVLYRMLLRAVPRHFLDQISDEATRDSVAGVVERMLEAISDPTSNKTREFLADIRSRTRLVLQQVTQWQGDRRELEQLVIAVASLVGHVAFGWYPQRETTLRQCVQKLKNVVKRSCGGLISKKTSDRYLGTIASWKIDGHPVTVKRPTGTC